MRVIRIQDLLLLGRIRVLILLECKLDVLAFRSFDHWRALVQREGVRPRSFASCIPRWLCIVQMYRIRDTAWSSPFRSRQYVHNSTHLLSSCSFTNTLLAIQELRETGRFSDMSLQTDEDEHSIEMHLPYVRKVFEGWVSLSGFVIPSECCQTRRDITVVPILVGAIDKDKEESYGHLLAPYFAREDTFCVVSSDFCHW